MAESPAAATPTSIDVQDVMAAADAIRRQEIQSRRRNDDDGDSATSSSGASTETTEDALRPIFNFFRTPGVAEGFTAAVLCTGFLLPVRRQILLLGRRRNFGDLPDLIVTPAMVLLSLQVSMRVASLTGARTYLGRVPDMNSDDLRSFCNNPVVQKFQRPKAWSMEEIDQRGEPSSLIWWTNPEAHAIHALRKAVATCKQNKEGIID